MPVSTRFTVGQERRRTLLGREPSILPRTRETCRKDSLPFSQERGETCRKTTRYTRKDTYLPTMVPSFHPTMVYTHPPRYTQPPAGHPEVYRQPCWERGSGAKAEVLITVSWWKPSYRVTDRCVTDTRFTVRHSWEVEAWTIGILPKSRREKAPVAQTDFTPDQQL